MRDAIDDRQAGGGHCIDHPGDVHQFGQLREKDQDSQRVDETCDDRARHEAHQRAQLEQTRHDLQDAREDGGCKEVLQAVLLDQEHHDECHGSRGCGDHAGTPAREGDDNGDAERGVEADLGVDAGDDGKGNGFGNKSECNHEAGQEVATHVAKPVPANGGKRHRKIGDCAGSAGGLSDSKGERSQARRAHAGACAEERCEMSGDLRAG
ncbi:hypothetical protein D9M72_351830 [compost metagenome]